MNNMSTWGKCHCLTFGLWDWEAYKFETCHTHGQCIHVWAASSKFGTYRLCEQRRFRRACASAQSRQNLRCSPIQAVSQDEPSDRKPDPWSLWMAGHAQLKFAMTECSKTQIRLSRPVSYFNNWNQTALIILVLGGVCNQFSILTICFSHNRSWWRGWDSPPPPSILILTVPRRLWSLTVTCSCFPYFLYHGSPIMWVTYFS